MYGNGDLTFATVNACLAIAKLNFYNLVVRKAVWFY